MSFSTEQIKQITQPLRAQLGDNITWKYESRFCVMLSEFTQNKSDTVLSLLITQFPHEWDKKTVKQIPSTLQSQLQDLASFYSQEELIGQQVSIKIDVEPQTIRGVLSNARFIAIMGNNREPVLLIPQTGVTDGAIVM